MGSISDFETSLNQLSGFSFTNEADRIRARDVLLQALRKVQSPWDMAFDHCWLSGATNAAVKSLIDAGVFKAWAEAGGGEKNSGELAVLAGVDELFVRRLIRQLAAQHLVIETGLDTYAPTLFSKALADRTFASMYGPFLQDLNRPTFANFPAYAAATGYKNPTDATDCNFQHLQGAGTNQFAWIGSSPALASSFNDAMECHSRYNFTSWPDVYPTATIIEAQKPDRALVVDVGGGKGHDLAKFVLRHPDIPAGSLILQDLPDILANTKLPYEACLAQPYDFFTPQPVKGAKRYFVHNVLHDWPDETAVSILRNIAAAMEKGYSKLLIHESMVSDMKPSLSVTTSDLTMMAFMGAKERTESEWRGLIEKAGLKVVKMWRSAVGSEVIIETDTA